MECWKSEVPVRCALMDEKDVEKIRFQIHEMLEELLPEEPPYLICSECGSACIWVPDTGLYVCKECGLEQEEVELAGQIRFLSVKERKELVFPRPRWKSRAERVRKKMSNNILKICVESELSHKTAEEIISVSKDLFKVLRKEELIRGRGRTNKKVVFSIMYEAIWNEFLKITNELDATFPRQEYENMLVKVSSPKSGGELLDIRRESEKRFEKSIPILQKFVELRGAVHLLQSKYPQQIREVPKHMAYIYRKSNIIYCQPQKIDPSMIRVRNPMLYRLFELDSFRGGFVDDKERYGRSDRRKIVSAKITHVNKVKSLGEQLFRSFLQTLPPEEIKRKRKGLTCICTYIAGYLEAFHFIDFFIQWTGQLATELLKRTPFPKSRKRWIDFFGISKGTFHERLKELETWNPKLIEFVRSLEKIHSKNI